MYCSLANDAFVEMFTRHYDDEFTCNLEECMLFDVIRKVSTGLTEIGVVTIFSDGEALALRKLEDAGLEFNLILRRPLHAVDWWRTRPCCGRRREARQRLWRSCGSFPV